MTVLEFVVGMTEALAWPLAIAGVFLLFRKPLSRLIARIRSAKHGDTELSFAEEIHDASEAAAGANVTIFQPISNFTPELQLQVASDPRSAVLTGWHPVQTELKRLVESRGQEWSSAGNALAFLRRTDLLRPEEIELIDSLMRMRNKAAHDLDNEISRGDATRFLQISKSIRERLTQKGIEP
jgi:hypothetical protein